MSDSRDLALQIMENFIKSKFSFSLLSALPKDEDNAFITMVTQTSLRHFVYIQKILKTLISKKLSSQNPLAQSALILGATELLYMQTPDYAVINSYVALIKKRTDKYIAGFVNAVLRKINQNKQTLISEDTGLFFPQSFRTLLKQDYTSNTINKLEKISSSEPALDITCSDSTSAKKLNGTILPLGTIRLSEKVKIPSLPDYQKGTWWIQDFSASLAVKFLPDLSKKDVLELCAAPGGKTAQLMHLNANLTCLDISAERLKTLKENMDRLKLNPKEIICADGLDFLQKSAKEYDVVLLDAPCSATGTLRRHPEIVFTKTAQDITKQANLQKQFLSEVPSHIKKDGILVYCVCSLCKAEGEHQIEKFLADHPNFSTISLASQIPQELSAIVTPEGWLRILPHHLQKHGGADGFFIAYLKRNS